QYHRDLPPAPVLRPPRQARRPRHRRGDPQPPARRGDRRPPGQRRLPHPPAEREVGLTTATPGSRRRAAASAQSPPRPFLKVAKSTFMPLKTVLQWRSSAAIATTSWISS